jgi:hypothetical protein
MFVITDKGDELFATYIMGKEFWDAFPKMLPISGGGKFVSRAGIEEEELIELYLKKIEYDPVKHFDAMRRMMIWTHRVNRGEINGCKVGDFVRQKIWEVIEDDDLEGKSKWGHNI